MNNNLFRDQGYIGGVCEGLSIWSGIPIFFGGFLLFFYPPSLLVLNYSLDIS
jgi:hypothetical protein